MPFIVLVLILMIIGYGILTYNRLIAQIEIIRSNQKQIDILLERRAKTSHWQDENQLAYAKETYKDSVEFYNVIKKSFPTVIIVSLFKSKLDLHFPDKNE